MMKCFLYTILSLLLSFCGGGGGKYYDLKVAINTIGVKKEPFEGNADMVDKITLGTPLSSSDRNNYSSSQFREVETVSFAKKHGYYNKLSDTDFVKAFGFSFLDKKFYLVKNDSEKVTIVDENNNKQWQGIIPRNYMNGGAIPINSKSGKKFLAIYIDQQSSSHSSTFFILDSDFDLVYQEHLLGAVWLGVQKKNGAEHVIVSSEHKYLDQSNPDWLDLPLKWIEVGGNWRYTIP